MAILSLNGVAHPFGRGIIGRMSTAREFHPELLPRRSEWLAWLAGIGLMVGLLLASRQWGSLPISYWIFAGLIVFFALSISLGNWMDRRSVIRIGSEGIAYGNGLRSVRLTWPEILNVVVIPTRLGNRVHVQGAQSHFTFKTMGESMLGGQEMRTGFADGQEILEIILRECGMRVKVEKEGKISLCPPLNRWFYDLRITS